MARQINNYDYCDEKHNCQINYQNISNRASFSKRIVQKTGKYILSFVGFPETKKHKYNNERKGKKIKIKKFGNLIKGYDKGFI